MSTQARIGALGPVAKSSCKCHQIDRSSRLYSCAEYCCGGLFPRATTMPTAASVIRTASWSTNLGQPSKISAVKSVNSRNPVTCHDQGAEPSAKCLRLLLSAPGAIHADTICFPTVGPTQSASARVRWLVRFAVAARTSRHASTRRECVKRRMASRLAARYNHTTAPFS
jgi:hypothetical protein